MRLSLLWLVTLGLVCSASALQAQRPEPKGEQLKGGRATTAETNAFGNLPWAVAVSPARLNTVLPLFTAESGGTGTPLDRMAQVGMNKQEYVALKNSLMVARLDAQTPTRLQGLSGAQLQLRQANIALYNANKARLDAVLTKLEPEPGCALCTPGATTTTIIRR